jgi:two-component system chemotaxis response regulator CheB
MMLDLSIKVLVVDDSTAVRSAFEHILADEPGITLMGSAADPYEAVELMRQQTPDVVILDIVMPRMDGLTFLAKIMDQHPLPVIICSSHVGPDSGQAVLALERGAVEVIPKPRVGVEEHLKASREMIVESIRAAAGARLERRPAAARVELRAGAPTAAGFRRDQERADSRRIVVMGASTGGTEALRVILQALPADTPGIVIAQHMPAGFTSAFAKRLDTLCAMNVREATDSTPIERGTVLIAPGGFHVVVRSGTPPMCMLTEGEPVNRHRPSVDVLFRSAASELREKALGILLTGMGADGAGGLAELYQSGADTIAQDEATSVVFGMPAAAIKLGAAGRVLGLDDIAPAIGAWAAKERAAQ